MSRTYSAPMSYVGSLRRLTYWASRTRGHWAWIATVWIVALTAAVGMWVLVTFWYLVVFGLFGLFVFPFRLFRRSQRRREHLAQQQLELMQSWGQRNPAS